MIDDITVDDFDKYVTPAKPRRTREFRTDRNNNPIAAAVTTGGKNQFTAALDAAEIPWEHGDPFPNDPKLSTIRIKGDPYEGARAILSNSNALKWYRNTTGKGILPKYGVRSNADFAKLPIEHQNEIINGIYQSEGGSGRIKPADDDFDKYVTMGSGGDDFDNYVTPFEGVTSGVTQEPQPQAGVVGEKPRPLTEKVTSEVRDYEPEQLAPIKFQPADTSQEINKLARGVQGLSERASMQGIKLPETHPNLLGQRLTAKFDHPPTADEVDDALVENLGKGYGEVARRFRAELGTPLTANNVAVEKQPDGSYLAHARSSQGFVDAVNAYAQGGRSAYESTLNSQEMGKAAVARDLNAELKRGEGVAQDLGQAGAREVGRSAQFMQNLGDFVTDTDPQADPSARAIARATESIPSQKTLTGTVAEVPLSAAGAITRAEALGGAPMFPASAAIESAEKGPEAAYKSAVMTAPMLAAGPIAQSIGVEAMSPVARQVASRGIAGAAMATPTIASGGSPAEIGRSALEGAAFPIGGRGEAERPTELGIRRYRHADFGEVVESVNQQGVPENKVRVVGQNGDEHVIIKPSIARNQRAVPIREEEIRNVEQPAEVPASVGEVLPNVPDAAPRDAVGVAERASELKPTEPTSTELRPSEPATASPVEPAETPPLTEAAQSPAAPSTRTFEGKTYTYKDGIWYNEQGRRIAGWVEAELNKGELPQPAVEQARTESTPAAESNVAPVESVVPAEPPTKAAEPPPLKPSTTSARKAQLAEDRREMNLPEWTEAERKSFDESLDNAKEKGLDGRAELIADRVVNKPYALNDEETAGLVIRAQQIKNDHNKLIEQAGAESDKGKRNDLRKDLEILEEQFDRITTALKESGTEKGRALAAQKLTINQDYEPVSMLNRFKAKTGSKDIPEKVRLQIENQAAQIKQLQEDLAKRAAEPAVLKIRREWRRERRQITKKVLDEEAATIKSNIAAEFARLKSKQTSTHSAWGLGNLDPEGVITKESLKYVRNRVKAGVTDTAQLIDDVHEMISEFGSVTKRQVAEMISGYNRPPQSTRSELQQQVDALKSEMRRELKAADVESGARTEKRQGPPTPRKAGPIATKQAIESRYNKQIDELERRIRESDFSDKPKRGELVLDPQTQKLADKLARTKSEYNLLVERHKPWSIIHELATARKSGLLSAYMTHIRNIAGTAAYQGFEEVARLPAVVADAAMSTARSVTGLGARRTVTASPSAMLDGVVQAFKVGLPEAGQIMRRGATREQMETQQIRELNSGVKVIDAAFNATFRFMSASDKIFYNHAYKRNLVERAQAQAKTEAAADKSINWRERAKELVDNPTVTLKADAKHDGLVATFNNNNWLSNKVKKFRSGQGVGNATFNAAMDLLIPFDRTPTNVIARVLEAAPVTGQAYNAAQIAKSIWNRSMSKDEQRAIALTFGRSTTGTAITALGFALANKGLIETDEYGTSYFKAGKRKINLNAVAPVGTMLSVGANLKKQYDKDDASGWDYAGAIAKPLSDQPLLKATSQVSDMTKDPERNLTKFAAGTAFSMVPFSGAVRAFGQAIDPAEKRVADKSFTQQLQKNVPKWRESLPSETDSERKKGFLDRFMSGAITEKDLNRAQKNSELSQTDVDSILNEKDLSKEFNPKQLQFFKAPTLTSNKTSPTLDRYERMDAAQRAEVKTIMQDKADTIMDSDSLTETQKKAFAERIKKVGLRVSGMLTPQPSFKSRFMKGPQQYAQP